MEENVNMLRELWADGAVVTITISPPTPESARLFHIRYRDRRGSTVCASHESGDIGDVHPVHVDLVTRFERRACSIVWNLVLLTRWTWHQTPLEERTWELRFDGGAVHVTSREKAGPL